MKEFKRAGFSGMILEGRVSAVPCIINVLFGMMGAFVVTASLLYLNALPFAAQRLSFHDLGVVIIAPFYSLLCLVMIPTYVTDSFPYGWVAKPLLAIWTFGTFLLLIMGFRRKAHTRSIAFFTAGFCGWLFQAMIVLEVFRIG